MPYTTGEINILQQQTEYLKGRLEAIEKNGKRAEKWYIGPITTILILLVGLAVQWGMMSMGVSTMDTRLDKAEAQISELMINQARGDELIKGIKANIEEIKADVKFLRGRRR